MSRRLVVLPDIHVPYHDEDRVLEAFNDCRRADHVILLGDLMDAYPLMSHLKDPARKHTFGEERVEAVRLLSKLRSIAKRSRIDFIEGNHEERLRRYVWSKAPELHDIMPTIPELLELERLEMVGHPSSGFVEYGRRFKHGKAVRPKPGQSARSEMTKHRIGGFSAHTHRLAPALETDAEGRRTEWWECGHLLDDSKVDYVTGPDWQAGYVVVEVRDDGSLRVTPVYL